MNKYTVIKASGNITIEAEYFEYDRVAKDSKNVVFYNSKRAPIAYFCNVREVLEETTV